MRVGIDVDPPANRFDERRQGARKLGITRRRYASAEHHPVGWPIPLIEDEIGMMRKDVIQIFPDVGIEPAPVGLWPAQFQ